MNVTFPSFSTLSLLAICCVAAPLAAQTAAPINGIPEPAIRFDPQLSGHAVLESATRRLEQYRTIESKMRVRTDLLGQPLVGSGRYAQLNSTSGLLLRMELTIQAGQEVTSVKQISDGRSLWEHWRIGDTERVKHIDLKRVARELQGKPAPLSMNSSSLASGGLPRLTTQLAANFDFDTRPVRSGKLGDVEVLALVGVWKAAKLTTAAPNAVDGEKIIFNKLPSHLPHQVELLIGKTDQFPYRVTYHKWEGKEPSKLIPVVTTEFFEVTIGGVLDATQFQYEQPSHVQVADQTDVFLKSLGVAAKPDVRTTR